MNYCKNQLYQMEKNTTAKMYQIINLKVIDYNLISCDILLGFGVILNDQIIIVNQTQKIKNKNLIVAFIQHKIRNMKIVWVFTTQSQKLKNYLLGQIYIDKDITSLNQQILDLISYEDKN